MGFPMGFPIVYKKGEVLICEGCGNTISLDVDKYDDVMHSIDCKRKLMLDAMSSIPHMSSMTCLVSNESMVDISPNLARTCPAHKMLFSVVGLNSTPAIDCTGREECYRTFFQKYEDVVLKAAEILG